MRPAVYASVMRTRKPGQRRVQPTEHKFSWKRFFMLLLVGIVLFLPGLVVTIINIDSGEDVEDMPGDKVLYKYIGPAGLAIGIASICASGIYYCCWGFQSPVSGSRVRKHKKTNSKSSEHYDPLQPKVTKGNSNANSGSSHSNRSTKAHSGHNSVPVTPDQRSGRHNNSGQRHRTPSKSSLESQRSHHQNSRHRHSSQTRYSSHSQHSHTAPEQASAAAAPEAAASQKRTSNQVTFLNSGAPLAQGETTGSMDIAIDIDLDIDEEKKY